MKVGLVMARLGEVSDLEFYLSQRDADVFLFPEGYLDVKNLNIACDMADNNGKWLITGVDDGKELSAIVIDPRGTIVGRHVKTKLTESEKKEGYALGTSIDVISTGFGKIGTDVCFEIHFPEISEEYKRQKAQMIFNPIWGGMLGEIQYKNWNEVARKTALDNQVYVFGCSHANAKLDEELKKQIIKDNGEEPNAKIIGFAFAYNPNGECLGQSRFMEDTTYPVDIDTLARYMEVKIPKRIRMK